MIDRFMNRLEILSKQKIAGVQKDNQLVSSSDNTFVPNDAYASVVLMEETVDEGMRFLCRGITTENNMPAQFHAAWSFRQLACPLHRLPQALCKRGAWPVAEYPLSFGDVGLRVAHIPSPRRAVDGVSERSHR